MSPDIEQISFPPSRPMSNEAAVTGTSQYLPLLTQDLNPSSRAMSDFADGSDAWLRIEDANGIMLLVLKQVLKTSQPSTFPSFTNFQAASSNGSSTPAPAPPNPASAPTGAHMLWFASSVLSLATAVFATLIQEWINTGTKSDGGSLRVEYGQITSAILAFIDHSFSSDLVSDTTRRQRINISLKAIQVDSYLLQRTFYHALGFIDSAIFTYIDFILLADQHANDDDPDVRFLARCIVAVAINRLGDSHHTDERWAGIIQRGLNWLEDNLAEYSEQCDSTQLRNLIQLARNLNTAHPDCNDPSARTIFDHTLCAVRRLEVENAALGLRHEFCGLWNQLVASMNDQRRHTVGTESRSFAFSAFTDDLDPALQKTSFYLRCTVSSHCPSTPMDPNVPSAYGPDA
ncbi:hypothetical protein EDB92DRAFT_1950948 [Lactarius akahatsu]|uniref:DUF6535 domain-containing protein n=1 Tax=Lactarius akahatsu TaxID=416441 RepID=A0AAD4Q9Y8_9AGAM|nr:hypothetical protein EDB92DRAFT_1950948 [Lactarius akahatsu]